MDELSEEDKLIVARARKIQRFLSQPFHVAEQFTNTPGVLVSLEDTIRSFKALVDGEYDHLPEPAFYNVGTIEDAVAQGRAAGRGSLRTMADKLHFSLVSPERELFSGEVDQVDAPGSEGDFGVLAGHAPFMTALKEGPVRVHNDGTGDGLRGPRRFRRRDAGGPDHPGGARGRSCLTGSEFTAVNLTPSGLAYGALLKFHARPIMSGEPSNASRPLQPDPRRRSRDRRASPGTRRPARRAGRRPPAPPPAPAPGSGRPRPRRPRARSGPGAEARRRRRRPCPTTGVRREADPGARKDLRPASCAARRWTPLAKANGFKLNRRDQTWAKPLGGERQGLPGRRLPDRAPTRPSASSRCATPSARTRRSPRR